MKHVQAIVVAAALCGITQQAFAQAFNLDLGGSLATQPTASYSAGSSQSGYWDTSYDGKLRDVSGNLTTVSLGTTGGVDGHDIPGSTGDDERLMESYLSFIPSFSTITLSHLTPGTYDCYIYSWGGSILGAKTVDFKVSSGTTDKFASVSYGSVWPGVQVEGQTYARVRIYVAPQFTSLNIQMSFSGDFNVMNGLQLVPVPAPTSALPILALPLALARRRR